ncbi:MAG: aminoacyl-tRNA hydrolase [Anaerolineae bacterium]|nr:aminoacyl-tRNA hydrolase [Anaerolineae bacterium]
MSVDPEGWLIVVGLGNPGRTYAANRHNVGFHCVEALAGRHGLAFDKTQGKAKLALGRIAGRRAILVEPQTYVNSSGEAVGAVARFYKVDPQDLIVIYDDLDLPQGTIRLRPRGSSGGHNGIKSIIDVLGTQGFPRVRVGIGRPPGRMEPKDYVLQDMSAEERDRMQDVCERVAAAVETFIREGIRAAMNQYNGPSPVDAQATEAESDEAAS